MVRPICVDCQFEMKPHKNRVYAVRFTDGDRSKTIDVIYKGDVYICPKCEHKIITSILGETLGYEMFQNDMKKQQEWLDERIKQKDILVFDW